jgi:hypothetical protein
MYRGSRNPTSALLGAFAPVLPGFASRMAPPKRLLLAVGPRKAEPPGSIASMGADASRTR